MKTKFKSKILSILLVLVMVLSIVPFGALTAFAVEPSVVVTHDVDQIRELLKQDGDVTIKLDADAEKKLTAYSDFESYKTDSWNSQYVWTKIGSGNKTIDLNGYRLYVHDQSARSLGSLEWMDFRYIQGALLMEIPEGASLTVNDSNGGGMIWMDAEMPDKTELEGSDLLMERNIFAVTGGNLTVNGGEIHAGRSKEIYAQAAPKYDKDYKLIVDYTIGGINWYGHLYGYATWFLSGTAITAESGNVTINGGDIWGRGWDNWTLITRVPGAPNGADDFRDRCAALRLLGNSTAHIAGGNFYGRSDADAVQVSNPNNLTVDAGSFDVATNSWLVIPGVEWDSIGDSSGTADNINAVFFHDSVFEVHEGYLGSFGVPTECINDQSVKVVKGNTMTLSKNAIDPYIVIDDLNLYVNSPLDYGDISEEVYRVPEGCTVESVTWYKNGAKIENPESTYFQEGQRYSVYIALSVDIQTGTKFTNRLNNATINGKEAVLNRVDDENLILSADFGYCTAALEELEFEVIEPEAGQYSNVWVGSNDYALYDAVGSFGNFGDFRQWYVSDDGETWTEKSSDDTFEAGKYYRFSFEVHVGEGQEFAVDASGVSVQPDVTATVNGISATVSKTYEQDPSEHITVTVDFGQCPALISHVELTVTAPKDGETISYTVGSAHDTYYAIGDSSNYTDYRQWLESDTGYDNWRVMSPGETFTGGKYYKFVTDVYTKAGYEFPTYDNGVSIMPGVNAYINSYAANVTKGYEQDPSRYITVEYFFGICNDSVVENIIIENVTAPVAGEKPNYNWSIRGNGYQMDISRNNVSTGVQNGLQWWDTTTGSWEYVSANDSFIAGHTYVCQLYLVVENGYNFLNMTTHSALPTATINGNTAEINEGWTTATEARVYYTFTCGARTVDTITITDLEDPVGGNTPDTTVAVGDSGSYTVESIEWRDIEENPVGATFEAGVPYYALITVAPATGVVFADAETINVYVNGNILSGIKVEDNKVIIPVIIRKPSSAPIVSPYNFLTQPVGGTVNAGQTHTAYWQTTFIPTQTEIQYWDGEAWEQHATQQAQAAVDSFAFESANAASTRFRIVAYIGSDVVATSDEFVVTWEVAPVNEYTVVYGPGKGQGSNSSEDGIAEGTEITLDFPDTLGIIAIEGMEFDYWSIRKGTAQSAEVANKQPGDKITIDADTYIIAIWKEALASTYTVAYGIGEGSGSADYETDIAFGSSFTLKAFGDVGIIAPEGKEFDYWSIRVGSAQSTETAQKQPGDTIIINDNTYIIAMWKDAPITNYTITASSGANGTISPSGEVTVAEGEDKTFTITANSGYHIKDVKVNGSSVGAVSTYTFNDVAANATITVEFEIDTVPHVCNPTLVPEDAPDCTTAGKSAYYHCECGKNYEDAQGNTLISNLETWGILNALGHNPSTAWSTDGEYHWKECMRCAGQQLEKAAHSGGTATCTEKAVCATCNTAYGNTAAHNHGSEWETDANEHWNECACGDKANKAAHTDSNNDGKCDTCEYQMTNGGGNTETPDNPNNTPENPNNTPEDPTDDTDGLGAGAIVGIVIGSVAVVGIGGFALFWFVIKKKSFADLIAVFKK